MADQGSSFIDWAKVIIGIVQLLVRIVDIFEQKQLLDAGQKQAIADYLQKQSDDLKKAKASRASVDAEFARDPSSVMRPDQFTRKD